jgi:DNA-directed RNA polymerase specialized sigma24 family protein
MSSDSMVGTWLSELKRGNTQAAQQLWDCYFDKLVRVARAKLPDRFRRSADEEDVALSALRTFFRRAGEGQFSCVCSGDELWPLLVRITARKAWKLLEHEGRQKRGGGQVLGEAALAGPGAEDEERGIEQVVGREPSPDFVVQVADTCDDLLQALPDEPLRQVARLTLDGYTLEEIAARLEFSVATAGRKLTRVRSLWAARVLG